MFLFDSVFHVSADLRPFQRSSSYTAAVQGQERQRDTALQTDTLCNICVCGVCVL